MSSRQGETTSKSSWKGKTQGGVLGMKIFVFFMKRTGLVPTYIFLRFVSLYYVFFSPYSSNSMYYYFIKRLGYNPIKAFFMLCGNYFIFGQTLIDKVAAMAGFHTQFKLTKDDENFRNTVDKNKGLILMSAHLGNWALSGFMLNDVHTRVNIFYFDGENENVKKYMEGVTGENKANIIFAKDDNSHIFEMANALSNNEILCLLGDRFLPGNKTVTCKFLGEDAEFPAGMYHLAAKLEVPIVHVFTVKKSWFHYHLHSSKINYYPYPKSPSERDACVKMMAEDFIASLEKIIVKYPKQWFNYYPFWKVANDR